MHSDPTLRPLRDILHQINLAEAFAQRFDAATFPADARTVYAATRCLEIISEASRRLPPSLKDSHPTIPLQRMAAAGNIYRHDYEDVAANYVWDTLAAHLPPLRAVVEQELHERGDTG